MLRGQNIIYFGDHWGYVLRSKQQLVSVFAKQNKVLLVERRLSLRQVLDHFRQGNLRLSDLRRSSVRQISGNLFVFRYPLWAPVTERFPLSWLTRIARRLSLRNAMQKLQLSQPIVWFYHPNMVDLVNEIPSACLLLYHITDEYSSFDLTPTSRRRIEEKEQKMMAQVDAVIVVSQKLYEAKRPFNANTYLVPNGVNYQAYADALADPLVPDDLQVIKSPRLGYSGVIRDKLNLDMLKELAQENPEWSLVFLGHSHVSKKMETWRALKAMPNVHYLGPVEWSQVPHYVKGFDVGLMPYVQDGETEHMSPLKLYDYLAAGLPIASMDIPAAREFSPYIHLADSPRHFTQAVRAALADTTPERHQARRNIAAQHTWETRVEQLSDLIQTLLAAKAPNKRYFE